MEAEKVREIAIQTETCPETRDLSPRPGVLAALRDHAAANRGKQRRSRLSKSRKRQLGYQSSAYGYCRGKKGLI